MDTYKEVINEFPNNTSTSMMEDCVNKNLDDTNKTYFIGVKRLKMNL